MPEGTVTFGSQTHPADGNCGIVVASTGARRDRCSRRTPTIEVRLVLSYGQARTQKGFMAKATVPAAREGLRLDDGAV